MSRNELPWHRFGSILDKPPTAAEAIRSAGLDWRLLKKEIYVGPEQRLLRDRCTLVREDLWNKKEKGILGSVRADYTPLQNVEAFSFFDPFIKSGVAFYDSAGTLAEGKWVWIMLRFPVDLEITPNDNVANFLLFGNAPTTGYHKLVYLPVRLICNNTLTGGHFHNPPPLISTPGVRPRKFMASPEAAQEEIQFRFKKLAAEFRSMAQHALSEEGVSQYMRMVFDDWLSKRKRTRQEQISSKLLKECEHDRKECTRLVIHAEGNNQLGIKRTLWAAVSAVAEFVDFYKVLHGDPQHLEEVWFSELKASALKIARASLI